jgi:hypothetical protein
VTFTFDYNPAGQIVGRTVSNDSYAFALTAGSTAYASNGKNQMVQAGSAVPTWDKKGNLTSDGTNSYTYSSENLLTHVVNPGGNYSTASSPVYDPLGRLQSTGSNYDGYQAELVEDLAGQVVFEYATRSRTRRYVFGPEPDEVLVQYFTYYPAPQYNSRTWYQNDERGSIASMTGDTGSGGTPNRYGQKPIDALTASSVAAAAARARSRLGARVRSSSAGSAISSRMRARIGPRVATRRSVSAFLIAP